MKIIFERKLLFKASAKLIKLYSHLTYQDFDFRDGGEK